jgi:ATP-dependent phosphofructokinase / diphosphate-dependent phosphofructokinase
VANSERSFPQEWIAPSRIDVADDFVRYARPLIGEGWPSIPLVAGRQHFARLEKVFAPQKLPAYVPQAYR